MPQRSGVSPHYIRQVDSSVFWNTAIETDIAIVSQNENLIRTHDTLFKGAKLRCKVFGGFCQVWFRNNLFIAKDYSIRATDAFSRQRKNSPYNNGILVSHCDNLTIMDMRTRIATLIDNDLIAGPK